MKKILHFFPQFIKANHPPRYNHVTMDNINEYMYLDHIQYIDVREIEELQKEGYIKGFLSIPFYTELIEQSIISYNLSFVFHPEHILNEDALKSYFNPEKVIFLMCRSGRRSGFLKDILLSLGYEVYNIGGIIDYKKTTT